MRETSIAAPGWVCERRVLGGMAESLSDKALSDGTFWCVGSIRQTFARLGILLSCGGSGLHG